MKTFLSILLIFTLTLSKSYPVIFQIDIWPNLKHLNLDFSDDDNNLINIIEQRKENAEDMIQQAVEAKNREYMEKAFNELFAASRDLFDIYDEYCKSKMEDLESKLPPELDRPVHLEHLAQEKINESEILRNEAGNANELTRAKKIYMMAFDLDQLALLNKGRALRLYQDLPVIYEYRWYDDYIVMTGSPEGIIGFIYDEPKEKEEITDKKGNDEAQEVIQQPGKGIKYTVQIAAHSSEISEKELSIIYSGNRQIKMMIEDKWYKYYIGPYSTFQEAERVMKSLDMENVFLAAYLDGKRIGIGEARKRQADLK